MEVNISLHRKTDWSEKEINVGNMRVSLGRHYLDKIWEVKEVWKISKNEISTASMRVYGEKKKKMYIKTGVEGIARCPKEKKRAADEKRIIW